ncbi:MAG: hypothetical protein JSV79_02670 [Armatimonadota bacterium]|nr:MAG: hypothetical protein JSV79_02670 [Armatimonadota bacterium]
MADPIPKTSVPTHAERWPRAAVCAAAALVVLAVALRLIPGPHIGDDAYITFKYVRNLASGLGFTYNPGERVLGTTTPLYTLLLTALFLLLGRFGASVITISCVLNALLDGANALLLARLGARLTGSRAVGLLCAAVWALSDVSIAVSLSGMETPLYVFLILSTILLFLAGRTVAAALTCSLAVLTRPDGLLLALALVGYLSLRERRRLLLPLAAGLAAFAPWLVFSLLYFGSPIATSVLAKNVVYLIPPAEAVRQFAHHWTTLIGLNLYGRPAYLVALVLFALWLWGLATTLRRGARTATVFLFPVLYLTAFALANKPMFRWYVVPLEPFYLLGLGAALHRLLGLPSAISRRRMAHAGLVVIVAAVLCARALSLNLLPDPGRAWLTPKRVQLDREQLYARVAADINRSFPIDPHTTIATPEIGAFGYHSRARILDTTGLVSPEAIAYYPIDPALCPECNYAISPDLVRDLKPEMVLALEIFIRHSLLPNEWFDANYTLAMPPYHTDTFGSKGLLLFRRRDWPASTAANH